MKRTILKIILPFIFVTQMATGLLSLEWNNQSETEYDSARNALPAEQLAFPDFTTEYKNKISKGNYQIWSERKISAWARGQGFIITRDNESGGLQFKQAAVFLPPGLAFTLYRPTTEKGANNQTGWSLILDFGTVSRETADQDLEFQNILRYDVYINGEIVHSTEGGYLTGTDGLVKIQIPYIRDPEGKVNVAIKLGNHPRHFGVLYDARLEREP